MEYVGNDAEGNKVYKYDLPVDSYNNAIFNNNAGKQTETLQLTGEPNEGFYPLSGSGTSIKCDTYIYGE